MEREQRRTNKAKPRGSQLVVVVNCDLAEEKVGDKEGTIQ